MTRDESIKVLSILKAAYPNSYKSLTRDEANGIVNVWTSQFLNIPYFVVAIAVNKIISTNTFPPSISEVKEKLRGLYWDAYSVINDRYNSGKKLDDKTTATLEAIMQATEHLSIGSNLETPLCDIISGFGFDTLPERDGMNRMQIPNALTPNDL